MFCGFSSILIFDVFLLFQTHYLSPYISFLILIPVFFSFFLSSVLTLTAMCPHTPPTIFSILGCLSCFAPISHSLSPPLLHDSSLPISPPIPVFLCLARKAFVDNWLVEGGDRCCMPWLRALSFPPCLSLSRLFFSATPYLSNSLWILYASLNLHQSVNKERNSRVGGGTLSYINCKTKY